MVLCVCLCKKRNAGVVKVAWLYTICSLLNSFEEMKILLQQMAAEWVCWLSLGHSNDNVFLFRSWTIRCSGFDPSSANHTYQIVVFSVIPLWVSKFITLSESERKTEWTKWSTQFPLPQSTARSSLLIIAGGNVYCWSAYSIWGALVLKWSIKSQYRSIITRLAKRRKSFKAF